MSLTQISALFKKGVLVLLTIVIGYYTLILLIIPTGRVIIKNIQSDREPPNTIYGMLDPLEFVEKPLLESTLSFELNMTTGKLPQDIPDKLPVYKFKPTEFSFNAGERATSEAAILGFGEEDKVSDLKGKDYEWRDLQTGSVLYINIDSRDMYLATNFSNKQSYYPKGTISDLTARESATKMFSNIYRFEEDSLYPTGYQKVYLGTFSNNKIVQTTNSREAQVALVEIYRMINKYPILGTDPTKGLMRAIVRYGTGLPTPLNNPFVEAYYTKFETETTATYPIISVQEAWKAIQEGKGVISNVTPKTSNPFDSYSPVKVEEILIDNIYIAYYETPKKQTYLQPIYVFEGKYTARGTSDGNIYFYYPAIRGEYVKKINQEGVQ